MFFGPFLPMSPYRMKPLLPPAPAAPPRGMFSQASAFGKTAGAAARLPAAAGQATVEYLLMLIVIVAIVLSVGRPLGQALGQYFGKLFDIPPPEPGGYYYCLTVNGLLPGFESISTPSSGASPCYAHPEFQLALDGAAGGAGGADGAGGDAAGAAGSRGGRGAAGRGGRGRGGAAGGSAGGGDGSSASAAARARASRSKRKGASKRTKVKKRGAGKGGKLGAGADGALSEAEEEGAAGSADGSGGAGAGGAAAKAQRKKLISLSGSSSSSKKKKRKRKRKKRSRLGSDELGEEEAFQTAKKGGGRRSRIRYSRASGHLGTRYYFDEEDWEEEREPVFQASAAAAKKGPGAERETAARKAQLSKTDLKKKQAELKDPEGLSFGNMIKYFVIAAIIIAILAAVFSQVMEMQSREA